MPPSSQNSSRTVRPRSASNQSNDSRGREKCGGKIQKNYFYLSKKRGIASIVFVRKRTSRYIARCHDVRFRYTLFEKRPLSKLVICYVGSSMLMTFACTHKVENYLLSLRSQFEITKGTCEGEELISRSLSLR